jgi:hypothetical protein
MSDRQARVKYSEWGDFDLAREKSRMIGNRSEIITSIEQRIDDLLAGRTV